MKLYKIGQPQAIEPAIEKTTKFIDEQRLVWPALNEKLAAQNPGREKVVQFCLTFLKGFM